MTSTHRPNKSLGQNFLIDTRVQQRIVDACGLLPTDTVIEIGPGKGAITSLLLPKVQQLIAVEKDHALADALKINFKQDNLQVIDGDFLKLDIQELPDELVVVGNIPYYISTPIIEKILANKKKIKRAYMTVQLEFGERLGALVGNRDYGSLSCFVQYHADVKVLFKISPGSFSPQPKVSSCFLSLMIKDHPVVEAKDEDKLFKLIQRSFMQRRKTIANSLKGLIEQERLLALFAKLGIDPQSRAENLTLLNYIELSNCLVI